MTTVLVCGGRDFGDIKSPKATALGSAELFYRFQEYKFILKTLDELLVPDKLLYIINGGAWGADSVSTHWAIKRMVQYREFKISQDDWDTYKKAAGPIRNKQMLDEGKPDMVIAFPGGNGTANMIDQAEKAGVPIVKVEYSSA